MEIQDLLQLYARSPHVGAVADVLGNSQRHTQAEGQRKSVKTVFLDGLMCSSAPMLFAALSSHLSPLTALFILQDADEAGYFFHDLKQLLGDDGVLFLPSSYRRSVKYGQRDAANEILRTEVLSKLSQGSQLYIVSYPEAVAEQVISQKALGERMLTLRKGDTIDVDETVETLRTLGFNEVDYVYEPGQFAQRGSILDVYSFSGELPFRIDLFGDDIDSIRTFEVDTQLSKDKLQQVEIVPELAEEEEKVSFLSYLPEDTLLVAKDFLYVFDAIDRVFDDGSQFRREAAAFRRIEIGSRPTGVPDATLSFHTSPQPMFHKNFELLQQSLTEFLAHRYRLYILADSKKQLTRLRDIFSGEGSEVVVERNAISFQPVERTLHAGFVDHDLKLCITRFSTATTSTACVPTRPAAVRWR